MGVYKETKYVSERDSLLFGRQVTCGNMLTLVVPFWVKWFVMDDCSLGNIQAVCETLYRWVFRLCVRPSLGGCHTTEKSSC